VTRTAVATSTPNPQQCLTILQKVRLVIGILFHFGAQEGSSRYDATFDVNGDGVINFDDIIQVLITPTCPRHHHDDD
jgi:hypothetical protein